MKKLLIASVFTFAALGYSNAQSMAFRQGSFIIDVTEGSTLGNYTTSRGETEPITGCRDPLTLEFGITNRWGIGITSGTDIYDVNPLPFYGFSVSNNLVKVCTTEFTLNTSYHFFVTPKWDVSAVLSYGGTTIFYKGSDNDYSYSYNSSGNIVRFGFHGHYVFGHGHFGVVAMLTGFSQIAYDKSASEGSHYSTSICGIAKEFGLFYRLKK